MHCAEDGAGKYCQNCGQAYSVKRITLHGLLHEVFHFFSHLDKGFLFTLKELLLRPGHMQREYIAGFRVRHQKPFSMFFICASLAALDVYWTNILLEKYYHVSQAAETDFFHQYWVLLQIGLIPVYTLILYLFFKNSRYNYAEMGVLQLYSLAFLVLIMMSAHVAKFVDPEFETRYIEVPLITLYCIITNVNFFNDQPKLTIIIKTIIATGLIFFLAGITQDTLVDIFKH